MINIASDEAMQALGLTPDEFLPFAAIWPRLREGYLDWLAAHQATGATYAEGEVWKDTPLGSLALVGKIDRIDQSASTMRVKTRSWLFTPHCCMTTRWPLLT